MTRIELIKRLEERYNGGFINNIYDKYDNITLNLSLIHI